MSVTSSLAWAMRETGSLGRGEVKYWILDIDGRRLDDSQSEDTTEDAADKHHRYQHQQMNRRAHS